MNAIMRLPVATLIALGPFLASEQAVGQKADNFREVAFDCSDGGRVYANLYGSGDHGVVLAHGAVFDKEVGAAVETASGRRVSRAGNRVRGYGKSTAGSQLNALHLDVLAAVRYLNEQGAKRVSVVGGSMGAGAAARASVESSEGEIDDLVLSSSSTDRST